MAALLAAAAMLACAAAHARMSDAPRVVYGGGAARLLVHGKPFLLLGGELGNSSAGTAAQADAILPRLAADYFNTMLMPVAWRWVLTDMKRFPRALSVNGTALPILSVFGRETRRCDGLAFAALMRHVRRIDSSAQTVLTARVGVEGGTVRGTAERRSKQPGPRAAAGPSIARSLHW